ncbi:MAG: hypothetical protein PVG61_04265 [Dehalococcoidia bacterium]|jgi:hypothetical protein
MAGCGCRSPEPETSEPSSTIPEYPTAEFDLELASKFCPVIHLKDEPEITENFQPDPVQLMVDLSFLKDLQDPEFRLDPTLADLQQYTQSDLYLDVAELDPENSTVDDYIAAYTPTKAGYGPTLYARVTRDGNYTVLQYWFFYYFNDWRNYHEGDWELVQLNFPAYSSEALLERGDVPVSAGFSQHQAGQKMTWADMHSEGLVYDQTHPLVYVAQGSHANYFTPGYYWSGLDFDDTGTSDWIVLNPRDVDVVLLEDEAQMEPKEWLDFRGAWGEHSGFSFSVMELEFHQSGPSGPPWSEGGGTSQKWEHPAVWSDDLPEYPDPFWLSFFHMIGDWLTEAIFSIFSPADLHVYDSQGRHVGLDEQGNLEIEIPGALYITPEGTDFKTILIPDADVTDEFRVVVEGTGDGILDLKALVPDSAKNIRRYLEYQDIPINPVMDAELRIVPEMIDTLSPEKDTGTLKDLSSKLLIDSDGDGVFETETLPGIFANKFSNTFEGWWQQFRSPVNYPTANYPYFYRGAWASRIDEARSYLLNAEILRAAGFDTIMLGIDIVFNPENGEPESLGDEVFIFYLQALKQAGFRIVLVPNPMHPNLDMGLGFEWDADSADAAYHRSYELLKKFDDVVLKWASIAEQYQVDGFAPLNEPAKLVWDHNDASRWLQEIVPQIKKYYRGKLFAVDTMYDLGQGLSTPYPYDYYGYDVILGGPPAGRKDYAGWEEMINIYINEGIGYSREYKSEGFGLYEWGGYTGGVWYEDAQMANLDQILTTEEAWLITTAAIQQAKGTIASFPRISTGWIDFDTPAFLLLSKWYYQFGIPVQPFVPSSWTYQELIDIEARLAGADYPDIFQLDSQP